MLAVYRRIYLDQRVDRVDVVPLGCWIASPSLA